MKEKSGRINKMKTRERAREKERTSERASERTRDKTDKEIGMFSVHLKITLSPLFFATKRRKISVSIISNKKCI